MTKKEIAEYIYKNTGFFIPDYVLEVIWGLVNRRDKT